MITNDDDAALLGKALAAVQQYRIGARYADRHDNDTYTLIALLIETTVCGYEVYPVLLGDYELAHEVCDIRDYDADMDDLSLVEDDPETAAKARAFAQQNREAFTLQGCEDFLWDQPVSIEQIDAVLEYGTADSAWREAELAQVKAAQQRALCVASVAWKSGNNQSAAGRLLGMDQSRVSRAMETAIRLTGGYGS